MKKKLYLTGHSKALCLITFPKHQIRKVGQIGIFSTHIRFYFNMRLAKT